MTRRYGRLLCLRQNSRDPADWEWDECLDLLCEDEIVSQAGMRVFVVTDGGGPTPEQRKRLAECLRGVPVRIAVCTESIRTRFVVSSVAMFSSRIQVFGRSDTPAAYDYLNLEEIERATARKFVLEATPLVGGRVF